MKRRDVVRWLAGLGVAGAVTAGCGTADDGSSGDGPESPEATGSPSAVSGGSALSAAAGEIDGVVHPRYEDWYASTVLDQGRGVLTVYRKPGSGLDKAVRARVSGVKLVFRDAELSEKAMLALVRKVVADTAYWHRRDIDITGGGPLQDGSGVEVMTKAGKAAEATRLSEHYGSRVVVQRGNAVASPGGRFTPSAQGRDGSPNPA